MSNYILTANGQLYHVEASESELYHYGVPGMKWGKRKAQTPYESLRTRRLKKKVARQTEVAKSWDDPSPINVKSAGNKMTFSKKEVKEIRDAAYKRLNKLEVKLVKSQMADKIYSGQSVVGKMYSKLTDAHRYEADIQYDLEKRSKVNKAWRD